MRKYHTVIRLTEEKKLMEKDQFTITRKFHADGLPYFTVVFGWEENPEAGTTTRVFNTRMLAIAFINEELQKDPAVVIDGEVYPSHVKKLFGWRTLKLVPAIALEAHHSLYKSGIRWVHWDSVEANGGELIYYHKKHWSVVG